MRKFLIGPVRRTCVWSPWFLHRVWTLEPVCLGSNFSSISVVTSGNFLISLCFSFFIWKVGLILALPWDCWEELMNLCVVSTKNMPGTHNVYEHWLYGHFYELRFLVASSAFWRAFCLTLCLLALRKDFHWQKIRRTTKESYISGYIHGPLFSSQHCV